MKRVQDYGFITTTCHGQTLHNVQKMIVLSHVRSSVTKNNGFWIRWLDLLALLLQLQQLTINDCLRLAPFLTGLRVSSLLRDWLGSDLRISHYFSFRYPLVSTPQLNISFWILLRLNDWTHEQTHLNWTLESSQSQSYIATDRQSVSKSWCRTPSGAHGQIFITLDRKSVV
jgi:hypothetical protein